MSQIISALPSRWRGKIQNRFLNDWVIERVVISCLSQRKRAVKDNMSEASNASDSEPASDKESTNITSKHKGKSKAIILSEGSDLEVCLALYTSVESSDWIIFSPIFHTMRNLQHR